MLSGVSNARRTQGPRTHARTQPLYLYLWCVTTYFFPAIPLSPPLPYTRHQLSHPPYQNRITTTTTNMDYLSDDVLRGLEVIGEDSFPDGEFKKLVDITVAILLQSKLPSDLLGTHPSILLICVGGHRSVLLSFSIFILLLSSLFSPCWTSLLYRSREVVKNRAEEKG